MSNNCSNCYNGCTEITSDKCVKYTGVDVPVLGIQNGDSLSYVEQSLIGFLTSSLDGTGIFPVIPQTDICPSLQAELDDCNPLSLNNYLTGIIKFLCSLEEQISGEGSGQGSDYDLDCIDIPAGSDPSDTQVVLQNVIYKVCTLVDQLNSFITFVENTYVRISDINTYIENYLQNDPGQQIIANRMVPFSIVAATGGPAFLNNFDASGAGIGDWVNIYLCNGENGTPDLRGRVLVGTSDGSMLGGQMDTAVSPTEPDNPTYTISTPIGSNSITLSEGQIPAHTHTSTVSSAGEHNHFMYNNTTSGNNISTTQPTAVRFRDGDFSENYVMRSAPQNTWNIGPTDTEPDHTHTVTIDPTGGGQSHQNYQPGRGVYYIIYIP